MSDAKPLTPKDRLWLRTVAMMAAEEIALDRSRLLALLNALDEAEAWKHAIEDAMAVWDMIPKPDESPRNALHRLIALEQQVALDPIVSQDAAALAKQARDEGLEAAAKACEARMEEYRAELANFERCRLTVPADLMRGNIAIVQSVAKDIRALKQTSDQRIHLQPPPSPSKL